MDSHGHPPFVKQEENQNPGMGPDIPATRAQDVHSDAVVKQENDDGSLGTETLRIVVKTEIEDNVSRRLKIVKVEGTAGERREETEEDDSDGRRPSVDEALLKVELPEADAFAPPVSAFGGVRRRRSSARSGDVCHASVMAQHDSTEALTDEHGFRCFPPPGTSPDDVAGAVAAHVGLAAIRVVQRENRGYVIYVAKVDAAARVVERGLSVGGEGGLLVQCTPLSTPAVRVTISGAPPYLTNAELRADLQRYGVVVSPIVMLAIRTKNKEMKHVMSGQRQVFLVLKGGRTELDVAIKRTAGGRVHTIYLATAVPRCYGCGNVGHIRKNCSAKTKEGVVRSGGAATERETLVPQLQQPRQPQQQQQREHPPPPPQQEQRQQQQQQQQGGADSVPECGESAPEKKTDDDDVGGFTVVRGAPKKRKTSRRENAQLKRAATAGDTVEPASRPVETGGEAMDVTGDARPAGAIEPGALLPDPASPTPTATGAIGVPGGAAAPGSTSSPMRTGDNEEVTTEPEGSGLLGYGIEPSETLAPDGAAEVEEETCADVEINADAEAPEMGTASSAGDVDPERWLQEAPMGWEPSSKGACEPERLHEYLK